MPLPSSLMSTIVSALLVLEDSKSKSCSLYSSTNETLTTYVVAVFAAPTVQPSPQQPIVSPTHHHQNQHGSAIQNSQQPQHQVPDYRQQQPPPPPAPSGLDYSLAGRQDIYSSHIGGSGPTSATGQGGSAPQSVYSYDPTPSPVAGYGSPGPNSMPPQQQQVHGGGRTSVGKNSGT